MFKKLLCWMGFHGNEWDLLLWNIDEDMFTYINTEHEKGWSGWIVIPFDKFGLAYRRRCKRCGEIREIL